jgi:hypothetical protein
MLNLRPKAITGGLVLLLLVAGCRQPPKQDESSVGQSGGMVAGSCVERYSADSLSARQYALDGVVTQIETQPQMGRPEGPGLPPPQSFGSEVTLEVHHWYKGGAGATVTLKTSIAVEKMTSVDFPTLGVGDRYLVSGDGAFVWGCGFTREYSSEEAQVWAEAFSG